MKFDFEVYILDKGVICLLIEDMFDVFVYFDGRVMFCGMSICMVVDVVEIIVIFGGLIIVIRGEIIEVFGFIVSYLVEGSNDFDWLDDDDFDLEEFIDIDLIFELNESDVYL